MKPALAWVAGFRFCGVATGQAQSYVPARKITVAVPGNVNGAAPSAPGAQWLDMALGKPVILESERKAVPLGKDELGKFVGIYDLAPEVAFAITVEGDALTLRGRSGIPRALMYQGAADGHPRFFVPDIDAGIEFLPAARGEVASLVLHMGDERTAQKRSAHEQGR